MRETTSHFGEIVRILVQISREAKELRKFFYIDRHRPVGGRLDLFRIRAYAVFTHDAPKKWYFAISEYSLLEVGIQLMLPHKCKNLTNVSPMNLYVRLSTHIPAMDEYIVEVTMCEV